MACLLSASWRSPGCPGRLSSARAPCLLLGCLSNSTLHKKKQTQRGGCKKLKRPEDKKCQNPGCPLSLALAEHRMPAGKEQVLHFTRGNMP